MIGVLLAAVPVGMLIGTVGVGGVLLGPALVQLGGLDVHHAAGTSSWCFLFTGAVGTMMYARRQVMPWRFAGWLTFGAAPAAILGAVVNGRVPAPVLWSLLSAITVGSGAHHLWARARGAGARDDLAPRAAVATGAAVGFGSALTGTGGPVLLVPALLILGVAPLATVAASQMLQLPIVGCAVLGYAAHSSIDYRLGSVLGVITGAAAIVGVLTAHRLRPHALAAVAASTLVATGLFLLALPFLPIP